MDQHTLFTVELAVVEQSSPRLAFGSPISVPAGCAELGIGCYTDSRLRNALGKELTICGSAEFMAEKSLNRDTTQLLDWMTTQPFVPFTLHSREFPNFVHVP
jgi:hypothetical protein